MPRLDAFLKLAHEQGCSDIHLAVGVPPLLRMNGELLPIRFRELSHNELNTYLTEILTAGQAKKFRSGADLDFAYSARDVGRFRANYFHKSSGPGATFRYIPDDIPEMESLGLPSVVAELIEHQQGLILVTGSTGTGKSTTLAAVIDRLNKTRSFNIISLEDPIEFVHRSQRSQVIQREVGTHVSSFAKGLRSALREDPDVILVGELRDRESIEMAMMAAETGHLVLGTLHTTSAVKTIDRILDALPAEQREQGKTFLSQNLLGVITQLLVKTADGHHRKAIFETMVRTRAISKMIMDDRIHLLPAQIQTGRAQGMISMDQALLEAVRAREIDADDAYQYALDKQAFESYVTDPSLLPAMEEFDA